MIIYYYTCSINWHNFGHNRCIIAAMPKSIIGHMNGIMWTSLPMAQCTSSCSCGMQLEALFEMCATITKEVGLRQTVLARL